MKKSVMRRFISDISGRVYTVEQVDGRLICDCFSANDHEFMGSNDKVIQWKARKCKHIEAVEGKP